MPHCRRFHSEFNALYGFTLLEILVVIAVLSVLTLLGLAGYSQLLERSNESKCASNLRQVGIGHSLFRADHAGKLPPIRNETAFWPYHWQGQPDHHPWFGGRDPHPENDRLRRIATCPSTDRRQMPNGVRTYDYLVNLEAWSWNSVFTQSRSSWDKYISNVSRPSKLIVAADASLEIWPTNAGGGSSWMFVGNAKWESHESSIRDAFGTYHSKGRFNAVFFDGSVRSMEPDDLEKNNIFLE